MCQVVLRIRVCCGWSLCGTEGRLVHSVSRSRILLVNHRTRKHVVRENGNGAVCTFGRGWCRFSAERRARGVRELESGMAWIVWRRGGGDERAAAARYVWR